MASMIPRFGTWLNGDNTSLPVKTPIHQAVHTIGFVLYIVNLFLFLISVTFGTVSWILIPQWRKFQNYVFMNLFLACTVNMIGFNLCAHHNYPVIVVVLLLLIPRIVMSHWLLVTAVMFYMDIVKVYNTEVRRKYLKASLFSWVAPFIEVLPVYAIDHYFKTEILLNFHYGINIMLLVFIFILYIVIFYHVIKTMLTENKTRKEIYKTTLMVSAGSIFSGLSSLFPILIMEVMHSDLVTYNIALIMCVLTIIVGHIAFLSLKEYRTLWAEYWRRRRMVNNI